MQEGTDMRDTRRISTIDILAAAFIGFAILLGFIGGWLISPGLGFLVASAECLVIGILAGMS